MNSVNPKSLLLLAILLFAGHHGFGFTSFPYFQDQESREEYVDVACQGNVFVAITENGRIDWISEEGVVIQTRELEEKLTSIHASDQQLIVSGSLGSLFYVEKDASFRKIDCVTTCTINCLTSFKNHIIAGGNNGELRIGNSKNSFECIRLALKGNIVSLSSGNSDCFGVTDQGEIIHTTDGKIWDIFDFNKIYNGYYKACTFSKILVTQNQIAVIGKTTESSPVLYFSSKGKVWTQRLLTYTGEGGFHAETKDVPSDIYYDSSRDQFVLLFPKGNIMTIPSCAQCHELFEISENKLNSISGNERTIMLAGDNKYFRIIHAEFL